MVNRIIASFFFIELIIALLIAVYWVNNGISFHQVKMSDEFMSFLTSCSIQLNDNSFSIPDIPKISMLDTLDMQDANWWDAILNFFINFVNGFFTFLNGVTSVINFSIHIINYLIQLIQFIGILIGNMISMVGNLQNQPA